MFLEEVRESEQDINLSSREHNVGKEPQETGRAEHLGN